MNISTIDFCLSGFMSFVFEEAAQRMLSLDPALRISSVISWDAGGGVNRSVFHDGASVADMVGRELNFQVITRFVCVLEPEVAGIKTKMSVGVLRWHKGSMVEGQLYLGQIMTQGPSPHGVLDALVTTLLIIAQRLDTFFLHVSDEDDASLILKNSGFRLPTLVGVYKGSFLPSNTRVLEEAGAELHKDREFTVVWPAPMAELAESGTPRELVLEITRSWLVDAGYG